MLSIFLCSAALFLGACNLSDPIDDVPPGAEDMASDAGTDTAVPEDMQMPPAEMGPTDMGPTDMGPADMDPPDMGSGITAANFIERYFRAACEAVIRLDYQLQDFYWWESADDCFATTTDQIGTQFAALKHDGEQGRYEIDQAAAEDLIEKLENAQHPKLFSALDLDDIFIAATSEGGACSASISCIDTPDTSLTCSKEFSSDCEGTCVRSNQICSGVVCGDTEYCASGTCTALRGDGEDCSNDFQCENKCLRRVDSTRYCGELQEGDSCSINPLGCADTLYCDNTSEQCTARVAVGETCSQDEACSDDAVCMGGSCTLMGEGTPCRLNSICPDRLDCLAVSVGDTSVRACYSERSTGEPCTRQSNCPDNNFCDISAATPICAAQRSAGANCSSSRQCAGNLGCQRDNRSDQGTCEIWEWDLAVDQRCWDEVATCSFGLYCEPDTVSSFIGRCVERTRPVDGEACLSDVRLECVDGICDSANTCAAGNANGDTCAANSDCQSYVCDERNGACVALDNVCP